MKMSSFMRKEQPDLRSGPILAVLMHTFSLTAIVSPRQPECYLQSETKIEPDLRLGTA